MTERMTTAEFNDLARKYLRDARSGKYEAPPTPPVGSDGEPLFSVMGAVMATVDETSGSVELTPFVDRRMADVQQDMRTLIASLAYDPFGEVADQVMGLLGEAYDIGLEEGHG